MENKTLHKKHIAKEYSEKYGISKAEAVRRIEQVVTVLTDLLEEGYNLKIIDFVNFYQRELRAKKTVNPLTQEEMIIPNTKSLNIKMGEGLKRRIKNRGGN